ncbi:MAG: STAS domain-containing protein [Planctomycetes bacterium]|nr:STAS domain-containing protein [Planctomycetota bacterium]
MCNIITRTEGDVTIASFNRADVIDGIYIRDAKAELEGIVSESETPKIVLDFERVRFLSSGALGMLVAIHQRAVARSGALCVANVAAEVYEVFALTNIPSLLSIHATTQEAVRSFA